MFSERDCGFHLEDLGVLKGRLLQVCRRQRQWVADYLLLGALLSWATVNFSFPFPMQRVTVSPCKCIAPDPCPLDQLHHDSIAAGQWPQQHPHKRTACFVICIGNCAESQSARSVCLQLARFQSMEQMLVNNQETWL